MVKVLKVAVDKTPLETAHAVRGVGSYTRNLVGALKGRKDVRLVGLRQNPDLVHYPYFDLFFDTLRIPAIPAVVTVYDVIPLVYPKHYPPGVKGRIRFLKQKMELRKTAAVITISKTSKKDIVRFLDIPQEKIYPIHLAPGVQFKKMKEGKWQKEIRRKYGLPEQFVLYVGDVNYNKNVEGLLKAFSSVAKQQFSTGLVLVGKAFKDEIPETKRLVQLIKQLNLKDKVLMPGFVPDEDLVAIYNLATVYCQPSFYEGFGLPVLEAMAAGTPVVAAKTQALVEIAEGAALFVDPKDEKDIARGLEEVLTRSKLRNALAKKGLAQAKQFSWKEVSDETVKVYKKLVS